MSNLAFSSVLPAAAPRPKPRDLGLTEVRSPGHSIRRIRDYVGMLEPHLDSVRWAVGMQRLAQRSKIREINAFLSENSIEVSSGDLLGVIAPLGDQAVAAFIDESKDLGFTTIEISSDSASIPLDQKTSIIATVQAAGLKALPEVVVPAGADVDQVADECNVLLEAGAGKVIICERDVFDADDDDEWNKDLAFGLALRVNPDHIYWEASSYRACVWLIGAFGPDVNLTLGPGTLDHPAPGAPPTFLAAYVASARLGIFGSTAGRVGGYGVGGTA